MVLMLIEELLKTEVDFEKAKAFALSYNKEDWAKEVRRAYGSAAEEVLEIEAKADKNGIEGRLRRIESMKENWSSITEQLKSLPSAQYMKELLDAYVGAFLKNKA